MKLSIKNGALYSNNIFFGYVGTPSGDALKVGKYNVEVRYSHHHGKDLVFADGIGWIGASEGVNLVLGRVKGSASVIPSSVLEPRLLGIVEAIQDTGEKVTLTVEQDG